MRDPMILVVEDDPNDQELIRLCLSTSQEKFELVILKDGEEALSFLREQNSFKRSFPLILLDLKLPKFSGHEVLKRLREEHVTKYVPVVIFTSSKEEKDIAESYSLGANAFVRKPIEFTEFNETLKNIVTFWISLNRPHTASKLPD